MRKFLRNGIVLFGSVLLAGLVGCGPELTKEDLGTVTFELPKLDGADTGKKAENKKAEKKKSASEAAPGTNDKEAADETAKPQNALAEQNAAVIQQKETPAADQTTAPAKEPTDPTATPAEPAK